MTEIFVLSSQDPDNWQPVISEMLGMSPVIPDRTSDGFHIILINRELCQSMIQQLVLSALRYGFLVF